MVSTGVASFASDTGSENHNWSANATPKKREKPL
jgi:hypothetical protein